MCALPSGCLRQLGAMLLTVSPTRACEPQRSAQCTRPAMPSTGDYEFKVLSSSSVVCRGGLKKKTLLTLTNSKCQPPPNRLSASRTKGTSMPRYVWSLHYCCALCKDLSRCFRTMLAGLSLQFVQSAACFHRHMVCA